MPDKDGRVQSCAHVLLSDERCDVCGEFVTGRVQSCQEWSDEGREPQEDCPVCGHYALHHLFDGCHACKDGRVCSSCGEPWPACRPGCPSRMTTPTSEREAS